MHPDGIISNKKNGGGINKETKQTAHSGRALDSNTKKNSTTDFSDEADQPCSWTVKTKQLKKKKGEEKRRQQKKNGMKKRSENDHLSIL